MQGHLPLKTLNPPTPGLGDFQKEGSWPRRLNLRAPESRMSKGQLALPLGSQRCSVSPPTCSRLCWSGQQHTWLPSGPGLPGDQRLSPSLGPVQAASPGPEFLEFCGGKATLCSPRKPGVDWAEVWPQSSASHTHSWRRTATLPPKWTP